MIRSIKNTWKDFSEFIKHPEDQQDPVQKLNLKGKRLFTILSIDIPVMGIILAIIFGVEQTGFIDTGSHKMNQLLQQFPSWAIILSGVLIIPFIEELIFRLYLRFKRNYPLRLFISISAIIFPKHKEHVNTFIKNKWQTYYKWIFYLSAAIFALFHLTNYEYSTRLLLFTPLLILPQFIMGLFSGYLRVKYGLIWGFYFHALHNLVFLGGPLLLASGPVEKAHITNDTYQIKIEEVYSGKSNSLSSYFSTDSIYYNNIELKTLMAELLKKEEELIKFNPETKSSQQINLAFKSYVDSLNHKQVILDELQNVYHFTINKDSILQEVWILQISDTTRLLRHLSDDSSTNSITRVSATKISMENINLKQFVESLNSSYDQYSITKIDLPQRFNLKLEKKDFEHLNSTLQNEYGLLLKMDKMKTEYIEINFDEHDEKDT